MQQLHKVTLSRIDQVNEHVRLFRLEPQSGPISFSPGQWLDTYVPDEPKPGGFTITSTPSTPYLELAVQSSPDNPAAMYLWRPVDEILGATLRVRVGGSFVFSPASSSSSSPRAGGPGTSISQLPLRVVFVAGGVGVNPLMSMLGFIAEHSLDIHVKVLYASKVPDGGLSNVLFLPRIAGLFREEGKLRGDLKVFATGEANSGSGEEEEDGFGDTTCMQVHARRLDRHDLEGAIGREERESTIVYVCGPQAMTDELVDVLTSTTGVGLREDQVLVERWW